MKKIILSVLFLVIAVISGTASTFAFDPGVDDYDDLFYTEGISFEVLTTDETAKKATLTPGTFDKLYNLLTENDINESQVKLELEVFVNDVKINAELYFNNYPTEIALNLYGEGFIGVVLLGIIEDDTVQSYGSLPTPTLLVGDIVTIEPELKSWTKAYDYGRVRNYEDVDYDMSYDAINNRANIGVLDGGSYTFDSRDYDSTVGVSTTLAAFQSVYPNFRIIDAVTNAMVAEWDNVGAVVFVGNYLEQGAGRFYIYQWVNNEIEVKTHDMVNSSKAYFYGDIRRAISGEENFVVNVDELTPLDDLLQYITAWDDLDGDISDLVIVSDDGGYENDVVGIYDIQFSVTDSNGETSTLDAKVHVTDIVAPVITGTTDAVTISYEQDFNVQAWVNSLVVTDNYYTGITPVIETNTYSSNKRTLGTYQITIKATDPSGNKGTITRTINVVDGLGPVFTGVSSVTTSIAEGLTVAQIKAGLVAIDEKDGNVTASIVIDSDGLTGNAGTPGSYTVIFMAKDTANNQTFHEVTVTVISAPPGIFVLDGSTVRLLPGANLTIEQILSVLGVTEGYSNLSTNYNAEVPGTYTLSFTIGNQPFNVGITVLGVNDPIIPTPVVPGNSNAATFYIIVGLIATITAIGFIVYKRKN